MSSVDAIADTVPLNLVYNELIKNYSEIVIG